MPRVILYGIIGISVCAEAKRYLSREYNPKQNPIFPESSNLSRHLRQSNFFFPHFLPEFLNLILSLVNQSILCGVLSLQAVHERGGLHLLFMKFLHGVVHLRNLSVFFRQFSPQRRNGVGRCIRVGFYPRCAPGLLTKICQ